MKTISIINLKGGVAKTITATNMAHILTSIHGQRVLLIDNDKQGNSTKFFHLEESEKPNIANILTEPNFATIKAINSTYYDNLSVIGADMRLLSANLELITDETREQKGILRKALEQVSNQFDYCIIDNAPDINISVINALVAADEIIIPVKVDQFGFDGLGELMSQLKFNPALKFRGCLVTQYIKNEVNLQGVEILNQWGYPVFETKIRRTEKVDESTFAGKAIMEYSPRCNAAKDYLNFVKEYLEQ